MIPRHLLIGVAALLALVVSMGIYVRHMRRRAEEFQYAAADALPVAPPASGPTETVTLYVADDDAGVLRARSAQIPLPGGRQQRAEELLRALLRMYRNRTPLILCLRRPTSAASFLSIRELPSSI